MQVNAGRVAEYIQSAQGQFIVVSHRPAVYEQAGCVLGIFQKGVGSGAVMVCVPPEAEAAN